ncbi:2TM domain-containing protein [Neptunitalea lumnitzerae]|uniref:Histidine kinase n=1 Tax=Neptunitalea lumnitzerae TaxID=2965509 RepID=A0ABQ5MLP7_9FLAO|nr:2TM domain-containing protein [Neptunitalea sp. Y10]GLB50231.1 histidine kinase [Neptunitalea sp. Y10]
MKSRSILKTFLTGLLIGSVLAIVITLINVLNGDTIEFNTDFAKNIAIFLLYSEVLLFMNGYYFDFYNSKVTIGKQNPVVRVLLGAFGGVIVTMIGVFALRVFTRMVLDGVTWQHFMATEKAKDYTYSLIITAFVTIVYHAIYFYRELQKNKIKEQKIIAGTASAQFDALKNQLDPHFLFNSLNVLTSLIEENPYAAQKFTTSLSKVYRYVLEQKNKELVTVDEELKFARTFVNLLKMRFEDSIVFDIPDTASNPEAMVVPLSLQLLLENAVKHNMVTPQKPLRVEIFEKDGNLMVRNNLQPKAVVKKSSGVGLRNIQQRYAILTNRAVVIEKSESTFQVTLPMLTKRVSVNNMKSTAELKQDNAYARARKKVEDLKELYTSLASYCIVIPFLIFINYRSSWDFQWFWFPALGWGMGLGLQAFKVYGPGGNWEDRKIKEYMERDRKTSNWK